MPPFLSFVREIGEPNDRVDHCVVVCVSFVVLFCFVSLMCVVSHQELTPELSSPNFFDEMRETLKNRRGTRMI